MCTVIQIDRDILGGTPTFSGTRVPVQNLFDYIESGSTVLDFLEDFPSVSALQVTILFEEMRRTLNVA